MTASQIIRQRRLSVETRKGYVSLFFRIIFILAVGWILFTRIILLTQVHGNEMFPTAKDGDLIVAYRLQSEYAKNDVVVYTVNGEQKTGRVLGRATDVIMLDDSGSLLVNGTAQTGEIMYPTYAKEGIEYPYVVPENSLFILCDYRTNGTDSRDYEAIPLEDVEGKVITILRRRGI